MNNMPNPRALIAEDEPLLAESLRAELARLWPALHIVASVGDGVSALTQALALKPDILFFDIQMPGMSGLDAAIALADAWVTTGPLASPFPALVFVTAYDQYAIAAFEAQAMDYLLKPVQAARLGKTVAKLQSALHHRMQHAVAFDTTLAQLRGLLGAAPTAPAAFLNVIPVSVGTSIRMVPVAEVVYFEAADKYVRVLTATHEYLIRTPLKELLPRLDPEVFWQVHRGTVVNVAAIAAVTRDEWGKLSVSLHGKDDRLPVSRIYAHQFKAL